MLIFAYRFIVFGASDLYLAGYTLCALSLFFFMFLVFLFCCYCYKIGSTGAREENEHMVCSGRKIVVILTSAALSNSSSGSNVPAYISSRSAPHTPENLKILPLAKCTQMKFFLSCIGIDPFTKHSHDEK